MFLCCCCSLARRAMFSGCWCDLDLTCFKGIAACITSSQVSSSLYSPSLSLTGPALHCALRRCVGTQNCQLMTNDNLCNIQTNKTVTVCCCCCRFCCTSICLAWLRRWRRQRQRCLLTFSAFGIRQCVNSWMAGRGGVKALRHRFLYLCVTVTAAITALWNRNGARAGVTQWYPVKGKEECLTSKETEFHDDLRITMNLYILLVCSVLEYGSCIRCS